jgi:hypothetical protein
MNSIIQFKPNRSSYKPRVKAKINSHLLLTNEKKIQLTKKLKNKEPGVVEFQWDTSSVDGIKQRDEFLHRNGLYINPDDILCRWALESQLRDIPMSDALPLLRSPFARMKIVLLLDI